MQQTAISTMPVEIQEYRENDGYPTLVALIGEAVGNADLLFSTDVKGLFDIFLSGLPEDARQHYTCGTCRSCLDRFGGLVTLTEDGVATPVLPINVPAFFKISFRLMRRAVMQAKVIGVFNPLSETLGTPQSGGFSHMCFQVRPLALSKWSGTTNGKRLAMLPQDFGLLEGLVKKYSSAHVDQAAEILARDAVYRSERTLGPASWLSALHKTLAAVKHEGQRRNILWYSAATAPAGYCHSSNNMLGTLLDDLAAGKSFENVSGAFKAKMDPTLYQRPQALPSEGAIDAAEKLIDEMGIGSALHRRFAKFEELSFLWRPPSLLEKVRQEGGIFGHLKSKDVQSPTKIAVLPETLMSFRKFRETVLPTAKKIEILAPAHASYGAIVTATDPSSLPIILWDRAWQRNPFSWYLYSGGSHAHVWGLKADKYVNVTGVCLQPNLWQDGFEFAGQGAMFILEGAKESQGRNIPLGLFPEVLKSELHGVRSVIEAHSNSRFLTGRDEATACGLLIQKQTTSAYLFRITTEATISLCRIDRWD